MTADRPREDDAVLSAEEAADEGILRQADALMQRHRSFSPPPPAPTPLPSPQSRQSSPLDETEIPLLTEIVANPATPELGTTGQTRLPPVVETAIAAWLAQALPAALMAAQEIILTELKERARHDLLPQLRTLLDASADRQD